MNERLRELMIEAGYPAPELAKRAHKLADLIIQDCYVALFPALRDMISRGQAYDMIKQHFNVMAGADQMAGDGGYAISTHEKHAEFAAKRNYTYSDIVSDGGIDPRNVK